MKFFPTPQVGYAVGGFSKILKTTDGGHTWETRFSFSPEIPSRMAFFDDSTGVVALVTGELWRTEDQGQTWVPLGQSLAGDQWAITGFLVVDGQTAYAHGDKRTEYGSVGAVWKTTDAGLTWAEETLPIAIDSTVRSMCLSDGFVFATGGNGRTMRFPRLSQ